MKRYRSIFIAALLIVFAYACRLLSADAAVGMLLTLARVLIHLGLYGA